MYSSDEIDESREESFKTETTLRKLAGEQDGEGLERKGKVLSLDEASMCLNTLGKDESSMRYAYLRVTCCNLKLSDVKVLLNFRHVLYVDVSDNFLTIKALQDITPMPFVIQLYAKRNLLESCDLKPMTYLQDLSLAHNAIKNTLGIQQPSLEYLDLNYNQIYQVVIQSEDVPALQELEMRANYLFEVGGVLPVTLQRLYLAQNKISRIIQSDIEHLQHLQVLHLRQNKIRQLNGFSSKLRSLKYLNLRENHIKHLRQFRKLQCLPSLEVLIILQNPILANNVIDEDDEDEESNEELGEGESRIDPIRIALLVLLPHLKRINKEQVIYAEREQARLQHDELLTEIMDGDSTDDDGEPESMTFSTLPEDSVEEGGEQDEAESYY